MKIVKFAACVLLLCAATACANKTGGGDDVTKGLTDKEERLLRVADSTRNAGDIEGAKKIYRQVMDQSKKGVRAHLELAAILNEQKKPQEALPVLLAAEKLQGDNPEVLKDLANTMIAMGNPTDAIGKLDKAIGVRPSDTRLYNSKGIAFDMKDQRDKAQAAYKEGIKQAPETSGFIENNLAMSYIMSRKLPEATALLLKLANSPQATPTIRQNLALAYGLMGKREESMQWSLRDLKEKEAKQNQEVFEKLAQNAGPFVVPDTAVKPVTVIENLPPKKPEELTAAQKEELKKALQYMHTAKPQVTEKPEAKKSSKPAAKPAAKPTPKKKAAE